MAVLPDTGHQPTDEELASKELEERTGRLAGHLARLGVRRGDRVALLLGNRVEAVEGCLAVLRAGAVGVPLAPGAADAELAYFLRDSGAVAVLTEAELLPRVGQLSCDPPRLRIVVAGAGGAPAGVVAFEELAGADPGVPPPDDLGLDEPAWIHYTSGTTGRSKGVVSGQRAALWSVAAAYVPLWGPRDRRGGTFAPSPGPRRVHWTDPVPFELAVGLTVARYVSSSVPLPSSPLSGATHMVSVLPSAATLNGLRVMT